MSILRSHPLAEAESLVGPEAEILTRGRVKMDIPSGMSSKSKTGGDISPA